MNRQRFYIFYINILYFIPSFKYWHTIFLSYVCLDSPDYGTCLYTADSTDPLTYTVVTLVYFMYILPEDGYRSGPKHVVSSAQ
jgi:hypothetical protein